MADLQGDRGRPRRQGRTENGTELARSRPEPSDQMFAQLREAALDTFRALDEFDNEAVLSLMQPGRLREWKERFFDLRVALEEAHDNARA